MKIGFIDYFIDEWHANNYPNWFHEASDGQARVSYAYAMQDGPEGRRSTERWCRDMGAQYCQTIEEVVEKSDALVVLSPDHSLHHEALCQLPLRSGKPTYVDKTFAPDGLTARRILTLAHAHNTPCYSTSSLRFAPEYTGAVVEDVTAICSWGGGDLSSYAVHQLDPILMWMRVPARRIQYIPGDSFYTLLIEFNDGRTASASGFLNGSPFAINISARENRFLVSEQSYSLPFAQAMLSFFRTGESPVPEEQTLAIMDILGAGEQAKKSPKQWVDV